MSDGKTEIKLRHKNPI